MTALVSNWVLEAVRQFGGQLGIANCQPNARGGLQLTLPSGGLLAIEPSQRDGQGSLPEVLVYATKPVGYQAALLVKAGLAKSLDSIAGPYPVQVALLGQGPDASLLALIRLAERDITLPMLEKTVEFLQRWMAELGQR